MRDPPRRSNRPGRGARASRRSGSRSSASLALPFAASGYQTFQFSQVLIYAIALLGLNLLTGYNGQISLGHGAFFAIGAYVAAILIVKFGVPYGAGDPDRGSRVLRRRLPVRPAGVAPGRALSRAGDVRLGRGDAAASQVQGVRRLHRRRPGLAADQAEGAAGAAVDPRSVALLPLPRLRDPAVLGRRQSRARPHRPRAGGDPRSSDRGRDDGRRRRALQDARPSASAPPTPASPAR